MPGQLRASVILDYQNVHKTAHDIFAPRSPIYESLIEPMQFAKRAVAERNSRQKDGYPEAVLSRVLVFRGLPHVDYEWEQHRRCQDQARNWHQAGAEVTLRDLKYDYQRNATGRPIKDVNGKRVALFPPEEKGIDVLCALACVTESQRPDIDLVMLASRDTDLIPALNLVFDLHGAQPQVYGKIETLTWFDRHYSRELRQGPLGSLRPEPPRRIWNTNLGARCYEASLDRADYR